MWDRIGTTGAGLARIGLVGLDGDLKQVMHAHNPGVGVLDKAS